MTSVHVASGTETRAQQVGCSVAVNRGMQSVSTFAKVSKENFPNGPTAQGHRDMREGDVDPKINSPHTKQTAIILLLILS